MLRFSHAPDSAFKEIVTEALESALGMLTDEYAEDADVLHPVLEKVFTRVELSTEVERLLAAHQSETLYMPTEYHWLILNFVLEEWISVHNDFVRQDGIREVGTVQLGEIDLGAVADLYFWDEDFLLEPEVYNALTGRQKDDLLFTDGTFGVVNRLKPHPQDLAMDVYAGKDWNEVEDLYKPGENYPSYPGD